ncbi:MAG: F0F1 ATP synthase subunit B [Pseudomonadota bacterium]
MNINLTILGQSLAFLVFAWFCMKFVWPPIMAALTTRKEKIAQGLEAAERGLQSQEQAQVEVQAKLDEAKQHANEIINQAQKRANEIVEEAKTNATHEGDRIKASAQSEIDKEINRAKEQLRGQVSALAIAGAEKVLNKEINADAHRAVLDDLAAQI